MQGRQAVPFSIFSSPVASFCGAGGGETAAGGEAFGFGERARRRKSSEHNFPPVCITTAINSVFMPHSYHKRGEMSREGKLKHFKMLHYQSGGLTIVKNCGRY